MTRKHDTLRRELPREAPSVFAALGLALLAILSVVVVAIYGIETSTETFTVANLVVQQTSSLGTATATTVRTGDTFSVFSSANSAFQFNVLHSTTTGFDFDTTPIGATDNQTFRFCRHTNTTGICALTLTGPNSSSAHVQIAANGPVFFNPTGWGTTAGFGLGTSTTNPFDLLIPSTVTHTTSPGQGIENFIYQDNATYDTSTSNLTSYGLELEADGAKLGAGTWNNTAVHIQALHGTNNHAIWMESGDLSMGGINSTVGGGGWVLAQGGVTASNGAKATASTQITGTITGVGASSTTLTYGSPFSTTSFCVATPNSTAPPEVIAVTARSAASVTFSCVDSTTGAATNCVDFTYWCSGS